jgi:hypothetical protein
MICVPYRGTQEKGNISDRELDEILKNNGL